MSRMPFESFTRILKRCRRPLKILRGVPAKKVVKIERLNCRTRDGARSLLRVGRESLRLKGTVEENQGREDEVDLVTDYRLRCDEDSMRCFKEGAASYLIYSILRRGSRVRFLPRSPFRYDVLQNS